MKHVEKKKEQSLEVRVFQLECQLSMLHELVLDIVKSLEKHGIEYTREDEERG